MDHNRTIIPVSESTKEKAETEHTVMFHPALMVTLVNRDNTVIKQSSFHQNVISIGRSTDNDFVITSETISRRHLVIKYESQWWVYDLNSTNGIYIDHKRIEEKACLNLPTRITFGKPGLSLEIEPIKQLDQTVLPDHLYEQSGICAAAVTPDKTNRTTQSYSSGELKGRLLSKSDQNDYGSYTRMVRKIIHEDRIARSQSYKKVIVLLSILFLISIAFVTFQQISLSNTRGLAIDMFYDIKTLEIDLSQAEIRLAESAEVLDLTVKAIFDKKLEIDQQRIAIEQAKIEKEQNLIVQKRKRLDEMKARYQQYVNEANSLQHTFFNKTQYVDDLILRVARGLGESELELPEEFITEVKRYISYWQKTSRLHQAMAHLDVHGYSPIIIDALVKEALPLYFAYLPLQESNYDTKAIGPETRFGIAKGAWQFLPTTGQEYGLQPGPLANQRKYDAHDERFNFEHATRAGAKYLKYLYSTEAQASGLLVLASYNYGHTRIKQALNQMPDNPREKNFWKLIQQLELPKETYDYVLYIFSAAVINEDPLHFGFGFKPLF